MKYSCNVTSYDFKESLPLRECGLKSLSPGVIDRGSLVTPLAGVWVEIGYRFRYLPHNSVTPLAGVWVEIGNDSGIGICSGVTPLAGVWVEIHLKRWESEPDTVTPLVRVWVEITRSLRKPAHL